MDSNQILSDSTQWWSQIVPQIQYGRHLEKSKNCHISATVCNFDEIWHGNAFGPYTPVWVLKIYNFENLIWQMFL